MKNLLFEDLRKIAGEVIKKIGDQKFVDYRDVDYHGFKKHVFSEEYLRQIIKPYNLTTKDIQIEVVRIKRDMSREIHSHYWSRALLIVLGEKCYLPPPDRAQYYLAGTWQSAKEEAVIEVGMATHHGFKVEEGGFLAFLSVQYPPIERDGKDDYVRACLV